jgi:hypothetical protein
LRGRMMARARRRRMNISLLNARVGSGAPPEWRAKTSAH